MKKRLRDARIGEIIINHPPHQCSVRYCDPENERQLIRRNLLRGPPILPEHAYICKYGQIHVCDENVCMVEGPCLVSGITMGIVNQYSSYDSNDPRTYQKDPPVAKVPQKNKYYDRIENLIELLFYSPKRKDIVANWNRQKAKQCKKYKDTYIKSCEAKRVPVNLIHLAMLSSQYNIPCPIVVKPPHDREIIEKYTQIILKVYQMVQPLCGDEKIHPETIGLAVLYKMQQGVRVNGVVVLPLDIYLVETLPPMNDLARLGIDKKNINRGEQLIMGMYDSAQRQGIALFDL